MATTITRKTWTDDDGSGTTGTPINNARLQGDVYDPVDAIFAAAGGLAIAGPIVERGRAAAMGEWTTPTFNAANFGANGGTWTVTAGQLQSYQYMMVGRSISVFVNISGSTITGTPTSLTMKMPGGIGSTHILFGGVYAVYSAGVGWGSGGYSLAGVTATLYPTVAQSGTFPAATLSLTFVLTFPIAAGFLRGDGDEGDEIRLPEPDA